MEVLISIFVVSIGLLGVAALIPLAGHQTEQGSRNDRKANVGRRSFREFMVRGFNDPGTAQDYHWIANTGGRQADADPEDDGDGIIFVDATNGFGSQATTDVVVFQSDVGYCIDPLFLAANLDGNATDNDRVPGSPGEANYFPYIPDTGVSLMDSNLDRAAPWQPVGGAASPLQLPRITLAFLDAAGVRIPIANSLAEDLFYFRDDLNFDLPEDNQSNAAQITLGGQKRDAAENYSWFATLTPTGSQWTLSTVIVRDRNLAVETGTGLPLFEVTGRIFSANNPPTSDESGYYSLDGDVRIDWGPTSWANVEQLGEGISPGAWVFLTTESTPPVFNWYRVSSSSDLETETDAVTGTLHAFQDVMLVGPPLIDADMIVGYVIGTEAVYQKTINVGP